MRKTKNVRISYSLFELLEDFRRSQQFKTSRMVSFLEASELFARQRKILKKPSQ
jgi:hypothetical protein